VRVRPPELARDPALDLVNQHLTIDHAQAVFLERFSTWMTGGMEKVNS
jgi:hypothetical protein